jgi:hypothetical protein
MVKHLQFFGITVSYCLLFSMTGCIGGSEVCSKGAQLQEKCPNFMQQYIGDPAAITIGLYGQCSERSCTDDEITLLLSAYSCSLQGECGSAQALYENYQNCKTEWDEVHGIGTSGVSLECWSSLNGSNTVGTYETSTNF